MDMVERGARARDDIVANHPDEELVFFDGLDDAIVGVAEAYGSKLRVCYDYDLCLAVFTKDMGYEDAIEWMGHNVLCAYVGERTPIFLYAAAPVEVVPPQPDQE